MADLGTTATVIDALGGYKGIAAITGAEVSATYNWRAQGYFPSWTYPAIKDALRRKKHTAPPDLWPRMKTPRARTTKATPRIAAE